MLSRRDLLKAHATGVAAAAAGISPPAFAQPVAGGVESLKIEWSKDARADRLALLGYLESVNPLAAFRADERIDEVVEILETYPLAGRSGRLSGTRELVITGTRYIAAYRMENGVPVILRLLDAAQQWPDGM